MRKLQVILDHAENTCKENGAKLTNKRRQVLAGLVESQKAMSAYEMVDYCKDNYGESLPPMSVYRILDFLEGEHLVHKLQLANKYIACAHITCEHDHGVPQFLICNECQRVEEISIKKSTMRSIEQSVTDADFVLLTPQLELNCICKQCG